MSFTDLFGVPPDPAYVKFRDGLLKANDDIADTYRWRWSPRHEGWYVYSVKDWVLDDIGIADTSPGSSFDLLKDDDPEVELARSNTWLPSVFKNVQAAYARQQANWPNLVWSWRGGGDWRNAMQRTPTDGGPTTGPTTPGDALDHLPLECKKRIADVRTYAARGDITAAQAQRMIQKIVEECTFARP